MQDKIRRCSVEDFDAIYEIINDSARAYKGVIPKDRWHDPYMPVEELWQQIAEGVRFWGYTCRNKLVGVMGVQDVQDVTLIRHAYVRTKSRNKGIGGKLLKFLLSQAKAPVLIGTWKAAKWAIAFYGKHGFRQVPPREKNRLLKKYWNIPARQIQTSVVMSLK